MDPIRIIFLGTGDAFSAGGRNQAAILLEHPDVSLLLDCGGTTLASLNKYNLSFNSLDGIVLSHLHGDHIAGLPFLFLHFCYIEPRTKPLRIFGPEGVKERTLQLFQATYPDAASEPLPFELDFTAVHALERYSIQGLQFEPFRVPHMEDPPSFGFALNLDGRRIVYTGDSGWTEELAVRANGADLFICECSFFESQAPSHLSYPVILERLANCGARKMVLTHLGREVLARSRDLELKLAYDGSVVTL